MKARQIMTVNDGVVNAADYQCCLTMTDKGLSGWGKATGRIAKRVFLCKSYDDADKLMYRIQARDKQMVRMSVLSEFPNYPVSRYKTSVDIYSDSLFSWPIK